MNPQRIFCFHKLIFFNTPPLGVKSSITLPDPVRVHLSCSCIHGIIILPPKKVVPSLSGDYLVEEESQSDKEYRSYAIITGGTIGSKRM